eukprot:scaffold322979_cov31-Tisochrysis_lutea.AAC.1
MFAAPDLNGEAIDMLLGSHQRGKGRIGSYWFGFIRSGTLDDQPCALLGTRHLAFVVHPRHT